MPRPCPGFFYSRLAKTCKTLYHPVIQIGGAMSRVCFLIINPVSGGYSETRLKSIKALLEVAGFSVVPMMTGSPDDAACFADTLCRERDEPFIVACGGDGTVNGVINGLEPGRAVLAVLPLGTANVLARELAIRSAEDAVSRIIRGKTRALTIGVVEGAWGQRRFVLMAGIGLDGSIVENLRIGEKRILGKGAYLLAAARRLAKWERERFEVVADGRRISCHSVVACNGSRYGGSFVLAPNGDLFSPGLQAVCITGYSRATYVRLFMSILAGKVRDKDGIILLTANELLVSGSKPVQVDGDYCCRAPVRIRAMEGFARLIV